MFVFALVFDCALVFDLAPLANLHPGFSYVLDKNFVLSIMFVPELIYDTVSVNFISDDYSGKRIALPGHRVLQYGTVSVSAQTSTNKQWQSRHIWARGDLGGVRRLITIVKPRLFQVVSRSPL